MARVPYSPVPSEEPTSRGLPTLQISTPGAAFGENVAQAVGTVGRAIEGAGDEMFKRAIALKQVENDAEAKEAEAEYMIEVGKRHAEYNSLRGKAAVDAYPAYINDLKKLRTDIRDRLSNDAVRRNYDGTSLSTMGRTIFNGAGHAATENKRYVAGASAAAIDAAKEYTLQNPEDEGAFRDGLDRVDREVRGTLAPLAGWGPEQTEKEVEEARSGLMAARIIGLSRTKPIRAQELLEANRGALRSADLERTEKIVQGQLRTTGARMISGEVNADLKDDPLGSKRSLKSRLEDARARADKIAPNDTLFSDATVARVAADYNAARAVKRDFDLDNKNTIDGAIVGGYGTMPTTVDDLVSLDPKVQQAWEALPAAQQRTYMKYLAANSKQDQSWTGDSLREYQRLKGLAATAPLQFLESDVLSGALPNSAKRELVSLQLKLTKNAEADPRVTKALGILSPELNGARISKTNNPEDYYQFVGALQDALSDWQQENKKAPQVKDVREIGARLLQEQATGRPGWFGAVSFGLIDTRETKQLYSIKVPEKDYEAIKNDPEWSKKGVVPTDQEIQRIYTRSLYKKFYGGSAKPAPDESGAPPEGIRPSVSR